MRVGRDYCSVSETFVHVLLCPLLSSFETCYDSADTTTLCAQLSLSQTVLALGGLRLTFRHHPKEGYTVVHIKLEHEWVFPVVSEF